MNQQPSHKPTTIDRVLSSAQEFPYRLDRIGTLMSPDPQAEAEAEGVLNPAVGRGPDDQLYLFPRVVAHGNVSRIGRALIETNDGTPTGVKRDGFALEPDRTWERGHANAGVEDPRITFIADLGLHVMTYVAYGPLGPRLALATSADLATWTRIGPVHFEYDDELDIDLNMFPNKDAVFFPEPILGPDGRASYAMLHRPMWDLDLVKPGEGTHLPAGLRDDRPSIWISYVAVDDVTENPRSIAHVAHHRLVALPEYPWEILKIGAGPAPIRVPEGWLLIHHGVSGTLSADHFAPQQKVIYAAGAMILDVDDPTIVVRRTEHALLRPETEDELQGTVPNVVFPTAVETINDTMYLFYGMADTKIGVARIERVA